MTIDSYESHDGDTVLVNSTSCRELAQSLFEQMDEAHNEDSTDFFITSLMLIDSIIDELRLNGMEDDHVLDYLLNFIKQGECH